MDYHGSNARKEGRRDKHGTGEPASDHSLRNGRHGAKRRPFKSHARQAGKRECREAQ
jgi:hypothetical protein